MPRASYGQPRLRRCCRGCRGDPCQLQASRVSAPPCHAPTRCRRATPGPGVGSRTGLDALTLSRAAPGPGVGGCVAARRDGRGGVPGRRGRLPGGHAGVRGREVHRARRVLGQPGLVHAAAAVDADAQPGVPGARGRGRRPSSRIMRAVPASRQTGAPCSLGGRVNAPGRSGTLVLHYRPFHANRADGRTRSVA